MEDRPRLGHRDWRLSAARRGPWGALAGVIKIARHTLNFGR